MTRSERIAGSGSSAFRPIMYGSTYSSTSSTDPGQAPVPSQRSA